VVVFTGLERNWKGNKEEPRVLPTKLAKKYFLERPVRPVFRTGKKKRQSRGSGAKRLSPEELRNIETQ